MTGACGTELHAGVIRGVISAVDCRTRDFAELGYHGLTGSALFQTSLTILLTLYVAALGYRMLFATGDARLSDAPGIAIKIGAILALVASWSTFQTLVFDLASKAPLEIAGVISAPLQAEGGRMAASPVDGLQTAYDQLTRAAEAFGKVAPAVAKAYTSGEAAAGQALSDAAAALFATTAGVVSVATIAIGVLTAVGPLFITLILFRPTRGLFEGWVRALAAAAVIPIGAWVVIVMMLAVAEPWLNALTGQIAEGVLDTQAAMTTAAIVFVFCAAQAALVAGSVVIAMGFRWSPKRSVAAAPPVETAREVAVNVEAVSRAQRLAFAVQRMDTPNTLVESRRITTVGVGAARGRTAVAAGPPSRGDDGSYRRPSVRGRRAGGSR